MFAKAGFSGSNLESGQRQVAKGLLNFAFPRKYFREMTIHGCCRKLPENISSARFRADSRNNAGAWFDSRISGQPSRFSAVDHFAWAFNASGTLSAGPWRLARRATPADCRMVQPLRYSG
jgi:hypothetical protein